MYKTASLLVLGYFLIGCVPQTVESTSYGFDSKTFDQPKALELQSGPNDATPLFLGLRWGASEQYSDKMLMARKFFRVSTSKYTTGAFAATYEGIVENIYSRSYFYFGKTNQLEGIIIVASESTEDNKVISVFSSMEKDIESKYGVGEPQSLFLKTDLQNSEDAFLRFNANALVGVQWKSNDYNIALKFEKRSFEYNIPNQKNLGFILTYFKPNIDMSLYKNSTF